MIIKILSLLFCKLGFPQKWFLFHKFSNTISNALKRTKYGLYLLKGEKPEYIEEMFMSSNVESKKGKWAKPMDSNSTSPDHRKELSVKSKEKFKEILDLETDKNTDDTDASDLTSNFSSV